MESFAHSLVSCSVVAASNLRRVKNLSAITFGALVSHVLMSKKEDHLAALASGDVLLAASAAVCQPKKTTKRQSFVLAEYVVAATIQKATMKKTKKHEMIQNNTKPPRSKQRKSHFRKERVQ